MSLISVWTTDPNAFWRSRKVTARGLPCWMALSIIAVVVKVCSIVPLIYTCKESFLNAWVDYIIFQQIRFKTFCENLVIQFGDDR